ncbi:MAG: SMP-30/gluconolactonase/LRE family protein [Chloroflexi bacterium]|nr:SMP-30/gluconolactonase/LRE family protein [Chloroflexota bacterium]
MPLTPIRKDQLSKVGVGVQRPEDVVVSRDGRVWMSDQASAAAEALPDGTLNRVGNAGGAPNGNNMDTDGRIIIANVGGLDGQGSDDSGVGPVQRLDVDTGEIEVLADQIDGIPLVASNYPHVDSQGRIWVTHSTSRSGGDAFSGDPDGFLFRIETDGSLSMLATEIEFANGITLDPREENAYVCSTTGCHVLRYPINDDGSLGEPEVYGPQLGKSVADLAAMRPLSAEQRGELGLTDGCGFDQEGNLWVTLPMSNKVVAITPQFEVVTMIEDLEGEIMQAPTNVSWGGDDMSDLYIGSIRSDYVVHARSPVPGEPLVHQR